MLGSSAADSWYVVVGIGASGLAILESLRRILRSLWRGLKKLADAYRVIRSLADVPRALTEHIGDDAAFQQLILRRLDVRQPEGEARP